MIQGEKLRIGSTVFDDVEFYATDAQLQREIDLRQTGGLVDSANVFAEYLLNSLFHGIEDAARVTWNVNYSLRFGHYA